MPPDASVQTDTDAFARVREAFHRLIELDIGQRREELLRIEHDTPALGTQLRALLERFDDADLLPRDEAPPLRLGPFRVLHRIGTGGMGEVYLGERAEGGFTQQVAIKWMRGAALTGELTRRFLRERQILARLAHPNIAHLIDGGFTAQDRPWLAMEYIDGERIDAFCTRRDLDAAARVQLLLPVCEAVAFAHRNLIVHRDLKPANILVDAESRPKLLDFGIARLLDEEGGETRLVPMTPAYAAPEQRDGGTVTTATDVYQLGAVLRTLLAGRATAELSSVLEVATATEPAQRYASVEAFAADLTDWLERRPLRSGIGSRRERWRKTVWQWRWPLALLGTAMLALGVGFALVMREARAKAHEAEISQQTTQFLIGLFQGADPAVARGASLSAQDLLDQGNARLHAAAGLQPAVRARLLRTVADSYVALGHYERALAPAQEALALRQSDAASIEHADSLDQVGNILRLRADYARAEPLLRQALERRRALLPGDDPATIQSLAHLAALRSAQGDFTAADALLAEAAQAAQRRFGADATQTAGYLEHYAGNLDDMGQRVEARALLRRVLAIRERALGPDHPDVATTLASLGVHLAGSGHYDEAVALLERALDIRRAIYGTAHPLVAFSQIDLAGVYADQDRLDRAESLARQALESLRAGLSPEHPKVSEALNMLALIRILRRDYTGAIELEREVLQRYVAAAGEDHPDTLTAMNNLAYALVRAGAAAEAETLLRDVIARKREDNGQSAVHDHHNLASALSLQGKHAEAIQWHDRAVAMLAAREGESSAVYAVALRELALAKDVAGEDAESHYRAALDIARALNQRDGIALHGWTVPLAAFLVGAHRCGEAVPLLHAALAELGDGKGVAESLSRSQAWLLLGACTPDTDGARAADAACHALLALPGVEVDVYPATRTLLASCGARTTDRMQHTP